MGKILSQEEIDALLGSSRTVEVARSEPAPDVAITYNFRRPDRVSKEHAHDFDDYVLVVEGRCTVNVGGRRTELLPGDEFFVPKGTLQSMEVAAGTRTVHVFGGRRAQRERAL